MTRARSLSRLANTNAFTVDASQNVGIGSTIPDVRLDVNGDMNVTGTLTYEDVTNVETAGITTTGGLVVTGLGATIGGITTFFGDLNFGAAGVGGTITPLGHGGFTGIVTALGFQATGVITAASFRGDGSQLSGVDSSNLVDSGDTNRVAANTSGVVITGITTTTDNVKAADGHVELLLDSGNGRIKLNSSGDATNIDLFGSNGSATFKGDLTIADKIIHDGDTNTAIRFPGNDTFTVETSGSEALRVDGGQRLLIGGTSSLNQYGSQSHLQIQGTGFDDSTIALRRDQNNANPPGIVFAKSRAGSLGGNTIVQDDDQIGSLFFAAADGTDLTSLAAEIRAEIDGTPGGNDVPGRIVFRTTSDGAASPSERARITSGGVLLVGATASVGEGGTPADANSTEIGRGYINIARDDTQAADHILFGKNGSVAASVGTDTTNTIVFKTGTTEAARFDSSQRLLIGTTTEGSTSADNLTIADSGHCGVTVRSGSSSSGSIYFSDATSGDGEYDGYVQYSHLGRTLNLGAGAATRVVIQSDGDVLPNADDEQDLGSTTKRWANIYSADLQLSNEGKSNDVDGTWGQYTIQEGENDLFLLNRRNGKKYRFMLEEV